MSKKLAAENSIHKEQEPGVINNDMLTKAIIEQGHKGEAGRLARMDQVQLEAITVIRLEFQSEFARVLTFLILNFISMQTSSRSTICGC